MEYYNQGYDEMLEYIKSNGWIQARDYFNKKYPIDYKPNMSEYHFAKGEMNALLEKMPKVKK